MNQVKLLTLKEDVLGASKKKAAQNKKELGGRGILAVNVMSSPGAGKTSLILQTINRLKPKYRIAVIEGDVASVVDADKVLQSGVPVVQINIPGGCHLDAAMVENALGNLPLGDLDLIIIENVGNLICPAGFDLGEQKRILLSSAPEGDDKPHKYPLIFSDVDLVLLNKTDLLPYVDFNLDAFSRVVQGLNPGVQIMPLSCKTGEGLDAWYLWLENEIGRVKAV
jgi:hydrogenase nickel incorporation protein HypB